MRTSTTPTKTSLRVFHASPMTGIYLTLGVLVFIAFFAGKLGPSRFFDPEQAFAVWAVLNGAALVHLAVVRCIESAGAQISGLVLNGSSIGLTGCVVFGALMEGDAGATDEIAMLRGGLLVVAGLMVFGAAYVRTARKRQLDSRAVPGSLAIVVVGGAVAFAALVLSFVMIARGVDQEELATGWLFTAVPAYCYWILHRLDNGFGGMMEPFSAGVAQRDRVLVAAVGVIAGGLALVVSKPMAAGVACIAGLAFMAQRRSDAGRRADLVVSLGLAGTGALALAMGLDDVFRETGYVSYKARVTALSLPALAALILAHVSIAGRALAGDERRLDRAAVIGAAGMVLAAMVPNSIWF